MENFFFCNKESTLSTCFVYVRVLLTDQKIYCRINSIRYIHEHQIVCLMDFKSPHYLATKHDEWCHYCRDTKIINNLNISTNSNYLN